MARRLVVVDRDTPMLMPPSIQEWVAHDDISRFILEAVEAVAENQCHYNWRGTGSGQYPPRMMLALLIHCYAQGIFSSRRIERATWRDVSVRFITGDHHPDHDTIARFRRENEGLFRACFVQVLELAREMNIKRLGDVALDGSKIRADASVRRTMTYQAMEERREALEAEVGRLIGEAEAADCRSPDEARGTVLPAVLAATQARRAEMSRALAALEEQTSEAAARRRQERENFDHEGPGEPPRPLKETPAPTATSNLTDAEARLLPRKQQGGYEPSYNVQLAVQADPAAPLILVTGVCTEPHDRRQLGPMGEKLLAMHPDTTRLLVDSGYDNSSQIHALEKRHGVIVYCPPEEGPERGKANRTSAARRRTKEYRQGMRACLGSQYGRASQRLRATTVEPVIGWIKRTLGFDRFHLRSLAKVSLEWELVCLAFNVQLLHRLRLKAG